MRVAFLSRDGVQSTSSGASTIHMNVPNMCEKTKGWYTANILIHHRQREAVGDEEFTHCRIFLPFVGKIAVLMPTRQSGY